MAVPEAPFDANEHGRAAAGPGWFVLNAKDARWNERPGRGFSLPFDGDTEFEQYGVNLFVLGPGEPMSMYHWEADQEDFLVLSGEALLIIEGEERPLRAWDFVHCPPHAAHTIVGAGSVPAAILAIGARQQQGEPFSLLYPRDTAALRHGAGVEQETPEPGTAYARFEPKRPRAYPDGLLPG